MSFKEGTAHRLRSVPIYMTSVEGTTFQMRNGVLSDAAGGGPVSHGGPSSRSPRGLPQAGLEEQTPAGLRKPSPPAALVGGRRPSARSGEDQGLTQLWGGPGSRGPMGLGPRSREERPAAT